MKTQYRIIKKDTYKYLQYFSPINLIFIIFNHWRYIPNANNPTDSPFKRNKYLSDDNTDLDSFVNKYENVFDYLKKDYIKLKRKALQDFREFQDEEYTIF